MRGQSVFDVTRLVHRRIQNRLPTGVDRVCLEYVRRFGDRSRALIRWGSLWVTLSRSDSKELFAALLSPSDRFNAQIRWMVVLNLPGSIVAPPISGSVLFNMGHSGLDRAGYAQRVQSKGLRPVYFLHDLIPITHPEYCRVGEAEIHRRRINTMLGTAKGIIVNSQATLERLGTYAEATSLPMPPCAIAHLGPARLSLPASTSRLNEPYFVVLGTIEPRKNHLLLLHLWRDMVQTLGNATPRLVIIGQRGWECEQVVDVLDRCPGLRGFVIEAEKCSDSELSTYLHYARALLLPSFEEGYGMPLIEALGCGIPVIASDLPVFRELVGSIPEYFHPLDGAAWQKAVIDYTEEESPRRAAQLDRLKRFSAFTWDMHFERVETFLSNLELSV